MTNKKTIGELIEKEVRKQGIPITTFADLICCQRNNVYNLFRRNKIDIVLLKRISEVLNHNFFIDLANDLDLIAENSDTDKDKVISQFYRVVPYVLKEIGKSNAIILGDLPDDPECPVPDFMLPDYIISFTIGNTFKERFGKNSLLPIETVTNEKGIEVEVLTNMLNQTKSLNIKLDYKTEEEWRDTMTFAFDVHERFKIQQSWEQRKI